MEDVRHAVVNIRNQIADWSRRVQQNETALATLQASVMDLPSAEWQERMRQIAADEAAPLIERIKKLEGRGKNRSGYCEEPYSPSSTPSFEIKTSSPGPKAYQSRTEEKIQELSIASGGQDPRDQSTATGPKISESERAGTQVDVLSDIGISLATTYWKPPTLSNKGIEQLLKKIDFRNVDHLKALKCLDDRTAPRDCIMFSDC